MRDIKADIKADSQGDETRDVTQVWLSYSTDEGCDEQPTVLQQGEWSVPDHVLNVVKETVRTCKVMDGKSCWMKGNTMVLGGDGV